MAKTALKLVQEACYKSNIPAPSSLISTDAGTLQLLHLFYSVGEELRSLTCWPQLKRTFKLRLVAEQESYDLPADFFSLLPFTPYDQANGWATLGPMTDADWNLRVNGTDFQGTTKAFRLFGQTGRQFKVNPTPGAGDAGAVISFDYTTRSWLQPPVWVASESIAQNIWRSANGRLYKKLTASTHTTGTAMPTMEFGEGQDGSVRWRALTTPAFATSTLYAPGAYFVEGGNLYRVTVGGTSDGSAGPTGTTEGVDIVNGTLTCRYHSAASWAGQTAKAEGSYILISAQYYRCEQGGITGSTAPAWSPTTVTDNTVSWTFQNTAYEAIVADTDLCAFDDELMTAGLRAHFFLAKGMGSAELVYQFEKLKKKAIARWNVGKVFDMASDNYSPRPFANLPEGNWPTW